MTDTTATHYAIARHVKQVTVHDVRIAARHNDRTLPPAHAKPGQDAGPKCLLGEATHQGVIALLETKIAGLRKKPKANAVRAVEVVLTASPGYFKPDEKGRWDGQRVADFERMAIEFARAEYGDNLLQLVMHLDETSPHVHVLTMPIVDDRLCCKIVTSRSNLRAVQTRWADACAPLGLVRGTHREGTTHTALKDFYAAMHTPLPPLPRRPSKPRISIVDRVTGAAAEKMARYDKALAAWTVQAAAYKVGLEAKARIVDVVAPGLDKQRRQVAADRQRLDDDRARFDDAKLRYDATRDLDARSKAFIIKGLPRDFLEQVLGTPLPGRRDPVDILRDRGVVATLAEGVDFCYAALDAYGRRLVSPPPAAPPAGPAVAGPVGLSLAHTFDDTVLSIS